jgi:hypothetical protein
MPKKIDDAVISEIKSALAAGKSVRQVAAALKVDRGTVSKYATEQSEPVAGAGPEVVRVHLEAILACRITWTEQDRLLAGQLAGIRATLDKERERLSGESATVATASGSTKANPAYQVVSKLAQQESQLSKRLRLGAVRTAGGQYAAAQSPAERRVSLWAEYLEHFQLDDLVPGAWRYMVREAGCEIPEDSINWPNGPKTLPVAGQVHETGHYYPVAAAPRAA